MDIKASTIRYTLEDGSSFVPPYGDIHHRDEVLGGLGDIRLEGGYFGRIPGTPVTLGGLLGVALPTGRTEEDPFRLASEGLFHQHLQFGNGTVDPLVQFRLIVGSQGVGLLLNASGRFPVYANDKGYQGSSVGTLGLGPVLRLPDPLRGLQPYARATAEVLSPERWNETDGENSGRATLGMALGLIWNPHRLVSVMAQLEATALEFNVGAQVSRPLTATVGVSGYFSVKKRR